ncbi:hypothetical protein [Gemelliphila palaticanis]|uniref:Uncharacterized protein n=1 Tax=Gemelliphila palaticanis TaxID=81950 RepID=A0ABX2SZH0_9BACL|nr:hypothetical protein [Gemella palaticanis]MBF0715552.1 hypothetical protein [Gemella palaticanis]NYS47482.1 hypothetical protein [Gemella palaticanis]
MKRFLNFKILKIILFVVCLLYSFIGLHKYFLPHNISAQIYKLQDKIYSDNKTVSDEYAIKIKSISNLNYTEDDKNYYLVEHDNGVTPIEVSKNNDILKSKINEHSNLSDDYIIVRVYPMYLTGFYGNKRKISSALKYKITDFMLDSPDEYFKYVENYGDITKNKLLSVVSIRDILFGKAIYSLISLFILIIVIYSRFKKLLKNKSIKLEEIK